MYDVIDAKWRHLYFRNRSHWSLDYKVCVCRCKKRFNTIANIVIIQNIRRGISHRTFIKLLLSSARRYAYRGGGGGTFVFIRWIGRIRNGINAQTYGAKVLSLSLSAPYSCAYIARGNIRANYLAGKSLTISRQLDLCAQPDLRSCSMHLFPLHLANNAPSYYSALLISLQSLSLIQFIAQITTRYFQIRREISDNYQ